MKKEFPQNLGSNGDSDELHFHPGIIITEMPDLGFDSPSATQPMEQIPFSAQNTSSRERFSKFEEDAAEARYQQKRDRICAMLRPGGEAVEKNVDIQTVSNPGSTESQGEIMLIPSQEPQVNRVLAKSNNILRNSAEKRIAQINQNKGLILHSLDRLKNPPPRNEKTKPVVIKAQLSQERIPNINDEEKKLMRELEDLDTKLDQKRVSNKSMLIIPQQHSPESQSPSILNITDPGIIGQIVRSNYSKISRGIASEYTGEDLKRMVQNRSMSIASPVRITVTSPFNDEKPKQGYSQSKIGFHPKPVSFQRKKIVSSSVKKLQFKNDKVQISQTPAKEECNKKNMEPKPINNIETTVDYLICIYSNQLFLLFFQMERILNKYFSNVNMSIKLDK